MPKTAYLGFSAHTGELSDNFDIMSVETRNLYSPVAGSNQRGTVGGPPNRGAPTLKSNKKQGGGWGWFFFKLILVILVAGGAYVGYTAYRTKQRKAYRGF